MAKDAKTSAAEAASTTPMSLLERLMAQPVLDTQVAGTFEELKAKTEAKDLIRIRVALGTPRLANRRAPGSLKAAPLPFLLQSLILFADSPLSYAQASLGKREMKTSVILAGSLIKVGADGQPVMKDGAYVLSGEEGDQVTLRVSWGLGRGSTGSVLTLSGNGSWSSAPLTVSDKGNTNVDWVALGGGEGGLESTLRGILAGLLSEAEENSAVEVWGKLIPESEGVKGAEGGNTAGVSLPTGIGGAVNNMRDDFEAGQ